MWAWYNMADLAVNFQFLHSCLDAPSWFGLSVRTWGQGQTFTGESESIEMLETDTRNKIRGEPELADTIILIN